MYLLIPFYLTKALYLSALPIVMQIGTYLLETVTYRITGRYTGYTYFCRYLGTYLTCFITVFISLQLFRHYPVGRYLSSYVSLP